MGISYCMLCAPRGVPKGGYGHILTRLFFTVLLIAGVRPLGTGYGNNTKLTISSYACVRHI